MKKSPNKLESMGLTVNKRSTLKTLMSQWQLMLMSIPVLLYVLVFNYGPLFGWSYAFYDYNNGLGAKAKHPWIGWESFEFLFGRKGKDFIRSLRNTLGMSVINLVLGTVSAILLAILLNEVRNRKFKRTVQTVTYLPHFLSMVIVVSMAQNIFSSDGPINQVLLGLGLAKEPIPFLSDGRYFWGMTGVINVWKEVGWNTIIYISAMTSIDPSLYEAAAIDGAGRFQRILHVTLPGIKSTFVILLIMNIGHLLEAGFEIQYLLGYGVVQDWSETIDVFSFRYAFKNDMYSVATASSMFKSVVGIILLVGANLIAKKLDEDTLL